MPRFAVSDGSEVLNIIEAPSLQVAREVAGPGMEVVVEEADGWIPEIGWRKSEGVWQDKVPDVPGPWTWDSVTRVWNKQ